MGQITGGYATYSRTVKTGEFENKKAEVQLSFTTDGDDYETTVALVTRQAKLKCEEMLGLREGTTVSGGKARGPAPEAHDAAMEAKAAGKAAKAQKAAADKAASKAKVKDDDDEPEVDDEPEADEPEAEDDDIPSDSELGARIGKTVGTDKAKSKAARALIAKFSTTDKAAGIPKAKRKAFLAELAKLGKKEADPEDDY